MPVYDIEVLLLLCTVNLHRAIHTYGTCMIHTVRICIILPSKHQDKPVDLLQANPHNHVRHSIAFKSLFLPQRRTSGKELHSKYPPLPNPPRRTRRKHQSLLETRPGRKYTNRSPFAFPYGNTAIHTYTTQRIQSSLNNNLVATENTQTAYFRGRRLQGRRVALPEGYQGMSRTRRVHEVVTVTRHA